MKFDPLYNPYPSRRFPVYSREGMVATSSPQAAAAGLEALARGGNAVDAAVAAAACLTVTEPTANGIGSDAFALVYMGGKLFGLNASGRAPQNLSIERVNADYGGPAAMPVFGWAPVMVPGAPKAWARLSSRFGRIPLRVSLGRAIHYAEAGFPLGPNLPGFFAAAANRYGGPTAAPLNASVFDEWRKTFLPDGRVPRAGDILVLKNHAETLKAIAETDAGAFYDGHLTDRILGDSGEFGGYFCRGDFSSYDVEWVEPVSVNYRGFDVWEIPPNGQGVIALAALNILRNFEFGSREDPETLHRQFEAMKLAFGDTLPYITDPRCMSKDFREWLSNEYGAGRAALIGGEASNPENLSPHYGGTVYLAAADKDGNMVSYIQSNYRGFGSGVVVRGTGISLQNRGADFSLDPLAANALAPGKKCYHTIIPGFITRAGEAVGPFGVMGAYMQPQGHVQVVMNMIDFGLNPQQALDAPRWQWTNGKRFEVESGYNPDIVRALFRKGHDVSLSYQLAGFGRGQIIVRNDNGTLIGATEGRTDSNIAVL